MVPKENGFNQSETASAILSGRAIFTFPAVVVCQPRLIWPQQSIGCSCQSGNMAALLNSLFFVFKISFLPKYHCTMSNSMIILSSGAVGYNVIGVFRWIFPKC